MLFALIYPNVELSRESEELAKDVSELKQKMLLIIQEVVDNLLGIY